MSCCEVGAWHYSHSQGLKHISAALISKCVHAACACKRPERAVMGEMSRADSSDAMACVSTLTCDTHVYMFKPAWEE